MIYNVCLRLPCDKSKGLVVIAGFPKSGNTLLNETFNHAGILTCPRWAPPAYQWQCDADILQVTAKAFCANPFLGEYRCHIKTHLKYAESLYSWPRSTLAPSAIIVVVRNPFDMLLSATNYLRYLLLTRQGLSQGQLKTLWHLYPSYQESDFLKTDAPLLLNLKRLGSLDRALRIFTASDTLIPSFWPRSGTWIQFYSSFLATQIPTLWIRFEDIVKDKEKKWNSVCESIGTFLNCNQSILADAFSKQDQDCKRKTGNHPFFPEARANYYPEYFRSRPLQLFCQKYQRELVAFGYEDLLSTVFAG